MEDVENEDAARDKPGPGEQIREANTAMDEEDVELVYDHTRFWRDKVMHCYFCYYHGPSIIVEMGAIIEEFDERASRVHTVLDAQGVDRRGKGSPPCGGSYSMGVLREPPPEMR
jgi:hypothetical protein